MLCKSAHLEPQPLSDRISLQAQSTDPHFPFPLAFLASILRARVYLSGLPSSASCRRVFSSLLFSSLHTSFTVRLGAEKCLGWTTSYFFVFIGVPNLTLPHLTLPYLNLPYLNLPYLTLLYLTLPYLTLPYLTLPYLTHDSTLPYINLNN